MQMFDLIDTEFTRDQKYTGNNFMSDYQTRLHNSLK